MTRSCPVCRGGGELRLEENIDQAALDSFAFASRKPPELMWHRLNECIDCHTLFAPEPADLGDLLENYTNADFDANVESRYAAKTYVRLVKEMWPHTEGRVLDVGCGDGTFIELLSKTEGLDCWGIEPSIAAVEQASPAVRGRIFTDGFESFEPTDKFDLVVLFQTIEHLPDLNLFFAKVLTWLKPGGMFLVCCHDYRGTLNKLLRTKSPIYDIEHLQLFSRRSIGSLLRDRHLGNVKVNHYWNTYPLRYWIRLAPVPSSVKGLFARRLTLLGSLPIGLPLGNLVARGLVNDRPREAP